MEKRTPRKTAKYSAKRGTAWQPREKRRLVQLGVCLVLFLIAVYAKGTDRLIQARDQVRNALHGDMDLRAAFSQLGHLLDPEDDPGGARLSLWAWDSAPSPSQGAGEAAETPAPTLSSQPSPPPTSAPTAVPSPEPTAVPAVIHMDYTGPELPQNTTMDLYTLGLPATQAPVEGYVTSDFGWREHPIEGGEKFHYGVDLQAAEGTAVQAFAGGEVEYIGESDVYGLYLQLRHDNGVASFYAHCSQLLVQQGQQVAAGETVALSGATGEVTGPHLHFELKREGVRLNPSYYITQTQS